MDLARRALLTGRRNPAAERREPVAIGSACLAQRGVECRICGEACATGAIRFRPQAGGASRPVLDLARCSACGDCVRPCPVGAVSVAPPR
ncbi:MAG TPA: 4Fe-4S dicluster domain-containing protein [Albitalea sp.]